MRVANTFAGVQQHMGETSGDAERAPRRRSDAGMPNDPDHASGEPA